MELVEEWRPDSKFPLYDISNVGRVRRVEGFQCKTPRYLRPCRLPNGYLHIVVSDCGKVHGRYPHRMVAENFIGPIARGMTVNHKNGDKLDNRVENLEIVSAREQNLHAYRVLGRKRPKPEHIVRNPVNGRIVRILKHA